MSAFLYSIEYVLEDVPFIFCVGVPKDNASAFGFILWCQGISLLKQNGGVHPAAASDFDFRKRAIGGSACNALFCHDSGGVKRDI